MVKNPPASEGDIRDIGSIPGSGRAPGGGNGNPLQCSCLENPMDRGAWWGVGGRGVGGAGWLKSIGSQTVRYDRGDSPHALCLMTDVFMRDGQREAGDRDLLEEKAVGRPTEAEMEAARLEEGGSGPQPRNVGSRSWKRQGNGVSSQTVQKARRWSTP